MPKVSVMIPVYGVEKYIERCARSLFEQTLDDIEYIFVDDCTPDRSIEVLESIVEEYRLRFSEEKKVVRIERMLRNSGLPAVRRHGIQLATGDYVIHCDSDDWVEPESLQLMYEKATETNADIVVCDFRKTDGVSTIGSYMGCRSTNKDEFIREMLTEKYSWSVCNKLVRRNKCYTDSIVYPQQNMGEDLALTMQLMLNCDVLAFVPQVLYNYYLNAASITHVTTDEKIVNNIKSNKDNADIAYQAFSRNGVYSRFKKEIVYNKWVLKRKIWGVNSIDVRRGLWKTMYGDILFDVLLNKYIDRKNKLRYVLTELGLYPR